MGSKCKDAEMNMTLLGDSQVVRLQKVWRRSLQVSSLDMCAIGGCTTEHLKTLISRHHHKFNQKCFLMIGINDILSGVPINKTKDNISSIIKYLKKKHINIFISTLPPTLHKNMQIQDSVRHINIFIQSFATSSGITVIKLHKLFKPFNREDKCFYQLRYYQGKPDFVHLSTAAFQELITLIIEAAAQPPHPSAFQMHGPTA